MATRKRNDLKRFAAAGFLFIILINSVTCQDSFRERIYNSYIHKDMSGWISILNSTPVPEDEVEALYEYTLALYGVIGYCIRNNNKAQGERYLAMALELNADLLEKYPDDARFYALSGAMAGFQMVMDKKKVPVLGPRSVKMINKALELDPENPQALVEDANKYWHMPRFLGGSKDKALINYQKAIRVMEKDQEFIKNNWFYLYSQLTLANYYEESGLSNRARGIYFKLKRIEPEFIIPDQKLKEMDNRNE